MTDQMSKYWIGTSHKETWTSPSQAQYCAWQQEVCPTTQKKHWQYFLIFLQRKRFSTVTKLLPGDHLEIARDPKKARLYCMKTETRIAGPWESGVCTLDLKETQTICQKLKTKRPLNVIEEQPNLWRSYKTLQALRHGLQAKRTEPTLGILLTGPTGTGKSKIASTIAQFVGQDETFWADSELKWFSNYDQEKLMIVDEFRGTQTATQILRLIDRTPYTLPTKGGHTEMNSKLVLLTSNLTIPTMYPGIDDATLCAINRRIRTYTTY